MSNVISFERAMLASPSAAAKADERAKQLDRESGAEHLRSFLDSVRLLEGIDYSCEPEVHLGRAYIEQMALSLRDDRVPMPTLEQCCDVLKFLSFAVPISKRKCFGHSGAGEACGYNEVLDTVRAIIRAHLEESSE